MKHISESSYTIVSNGFADGPSQALRDYFVQHSALRVTMVAHPLVADSSVAHTINEYANGEVTRRRIRLPNKPPLTYIFDPFVPRKLARDSVWFGFNNLACLRGLVRRKFGRSQKVVYWAVDFVPNRFGPGLATRVYDAVDRYVCRHADVRVELTQEGLEGRNAYLGIPSEALAPATVVPMGAWLARTPKVSAESWRKKKLVYMGHIVERQGVDRAIRALAILRNRDPQITLEVVGGGPDEPRMRQLADELGLMESITFHGFVEDHKDVEALLAQATVALAPYAKIPSNFTVTSDPGKVKAYLGASLPIVLTDVPPIAKVLENRGAALLADDTPESVAAEVSKYLEDETLWLRAHAASSETAIEYDWESILSAKLKEANLI